MSSHSPKIEGQKAVNVLRVASAGEDGETITIGADVYELTTFDDLRVTAGSIPVDLHGGSTVKSQGTITQSVGDVSNNDTVTIDGKVYTFQTTLTNVDGHVLIADTASHTLDNLVAAINKGAGAGTNYALATSKHTTVSAAKGTSATVIITALKGGTDGDAITLAKSAAHYAVDAATLGTTTAGVDPTADEIVDALVATINASATERVVAVDEGDNEMLLVSKVPQTMALACTTTMGGSNNAWAAAAMYGGKPAKRRRMSYSNRVPTTVEVALGNMRFQMGFTPSVVLVSVRVTSSGAKKAWDGNVVVSGENVLIDNSGSTDWATTDSVEVTFIE